MAEPAVAIGGLTGFGDRTVVDDVSLEVRPGEIVVLLGPDGAGKTTTVEIVEVSAREGHRPHPRHRPVGRGAGSPGARRSDAPGGGIDPRARPAETASAAFHRDPSDPAAFSTSSAC